MKLRLPMTGEATIAQKSPSRTSVALHNLRGFVILIVIAFHSFLAYLASQPSSPLPFDSPPYHWKAIPISDSEHWFGFDLFCASQYVYVMQFMFFLSGLFVWPSFRRRGASSFVYDRTLRLGVPFLLGICLLMPLAHYPVYRVRASDPSWSAYWAHWTALPFWPTGPMWFLSFLLVLDVLAAALFWLAPRSGEYLGRLSAGAGAHPARWFIALFAASALAYIPLAAVYRPWDWIQLGPFALQPSFALLYVVYFFAGVTVGSYAIDQGLLRADGVLARRWGAWTAGAFGGFLAWIIPTALIVDKPPGAVPPLELVADLGFVLASVSACFGLAAVFLRFAGRRSPVLHSLSHNAYGIYLVHYLFVVWLQYLLLGAPLVALAKGAIVFAATLVLSWSIVAGMRRIPIATTLATGRTPLLARARSRKKR
jgi:peptidoglycan/LPS O-acetylase OafA/YrhL